MLDRGGWPAPHVLGELIGELHLVAAALRLEVLVDQVDWAEFVAHRGFPSEVAKTATVRCRSD